MKKTPQQNYEAVRNALDNLDASLLALGQDHASATEDERSELYSLFSSLPHEAGLRQHDNVFRDLESGESELPFWYAKLRQSVR